jgi:hypothetical protein
MASCDKQVKTKMAMVSFEFLSSKNIPAGEKLTKNIDIVNRHLWPALYKNYNDPK